jgi:UDP-N-acetylglucosamine 2-epimerase (non-hydrolysing)
MRHCCKVVVIAGTRPEVIKLAPVLIELRRRRDVFEPIFLSTAQHREMLDQATRAFGLRPDADLDLMQPGQTLAGFASRALGAVSDYLAHARPDAVLVQGDTTTVMSSSLAAFYQQIPVGHVEAGLRSFDLRNPFPEEANRQLTSRLATWHFAPTTRARDNLLHENVPSAGIFVTGNTIVDALRSLPVGGTFESPALERVNFGRRIILVTAHRRENHGEGLHRICRALRQLVEAVADVEIVFPLHLNRNVQSVARTELHQIPRVHLVEPLGYLDLLQVLQRCCLVLTDSGGLQEEAPSFHKPVLILREVTERPEVVECGAGALVGTDPNRILTAALTLLREPGEYERMARAINPFGDGTAARQIADVLARQVVKGGQPSS